MKLSISWIFDHINADWRKQDIDLIIKKFNEISAEIEDSSVIKFNLDKFAVATVDEVKGDKLLLSIPEWNAKIDLPVRLDSNKDSVFMVTKKDKDIRFATLSDFHLLKDGFIPALDIEGKDLSGGWKINFEDEDIILDVDNKSITHRPDMWCHRGFAREIAAFMNLEFLPKSKFLVEKEILNYDSQAKTTTTNPISIKIDAPKACSRFAGIYFDKIKNKPTNPFILSRLLKVEARPINMLVDLTNYLTLDWSQPVHAYDASKIKNNEIIVRMAKEAEKLKLLDESELKLSTEDLVIADNEKPLCLGGVMGGFYSGISKDTSSIFFESANFDTTFVRRTSLRHKVRTESSMRFEKTLDKNQNVEGILRFISLLKQFNVEFSAAKEILSVGAPAKELNFKIEHNFFERRAGIKFNDYDIILPLTRMGFKVEKELVETEDNKDEQIIYSITVPTFRSSKDIQIKIDILEEIIRFYGFDRIPLEMPKIPTRPGNLNSIYQLRKIKNFFINSAKMFEQQNYIFLNEPFLDSIGLKIDNVATEIINPVSEDQSRIIPSLLPGLFKNLKDNFVQKDSLRFFEFGRVWLPGQNNTIIEKKSLAGIFFEKKNKVDFYDCKSYLIDMLNLLGIDFKNTEWKKIEKPSDSWIMPYQSADIYFKGEKIGTVGKVDLMFLSKIDVLPESDAFFFDFDGDFLLEFEAEIDKFVPLAKFQDTYFDLSLFVPIKLKTSDIEARLKKVSDLIIDVDLIDFFEKEDWLDKRSLTFRLSIVDREQTIEKSQIDEIRANALSSLQEIGITLRD